MTEKEDIEPINNLLEIIKRAGQLNKGESKTIKCPICEQDMVVGRSGYNGHLSAICKNEKYIKIIE